MSVPRNVTCSIVAETRLDSVLCLLTVLVKRLTAKKAVEEFMRVTRQNHGRGPGLQRLFRHAPRRLSIPTVQIIPAGGKKHIHHRFLLEIGRASCRERV